MTFCLVSLRQRKSLFSLNHNALVLDINRLLSPLFPVLLTALFLTGSFSAAFSQSGGDKVRLTGLVKDERGAAIPYATVALYKLSDSELVDGGTTNDKGKFEITAEPGEYFVKVKFLAYQEELIEGVVLSNKPVNLGEITLMESATLLDEAVIEADRNQMELKLDKRVFTVGQDLSNIGRNASETLDNLPSVNVDVDGNVSLRGSGNVQILIDGKPSGMIGMDPANALRQIPSELIDRIEIITNPSARYQAEGEVGIINIILKKDERRGVNGTFSARAGYPGNLGASANINFRQKSINWFAQYGIDYRKNPGGGNLYQRYDSPDTTYSYRRKREHVRSNLSHNVRAGADIFIDETNTITVSGVFQYGNGKNTVENTYRDFDAFDTQTESIVRDQDEKELERMIEGSVSHTKKFTREGHKWETTLQYYFESDNEDSDLSEVSDDAGILPSYQQTANAQEERNLLFKSDYVHPIGEEGKLETGMRITNRYILSDYRVSVRNEGEDFTIVDSLDNSFNYDEAIYAAYLMYGNKIGSFSYQAGLRVELSDIGTELIETDEVNNRNYVDVFPSVHLGYQINDLNSVQLTYSRRLSRPHFYSLLPFFNFSDNRNFYAGNPNLEPEYTDSYEAGYLLFGNKGSFMSSVYYRHRTGVIERISLADDLGVTTRIPVNLGVQDAYGLEFNVSYRPFQWWSLNGDLNLYRAVTTGSYEGQSLGSDTYTWNTRITSKFSIGKKTDAQLSGFYRAPRKSAQGESKGLYSLNFSASRDVLKGNGTIGLSVRDLLNTRKYQSITEGEYFYQESDFQWSSRQIVLSFTYRLNQKKSRGRQSGSDGGGFEGGEGM